MCSVLYISAVFAILASRTNFGYAMAQKSRKKQKIPATQQTGAAAQEGLVLVDARGCIVSASAVICTMLGYESEELTGMSFQDIAATSGGPDEEPRENRSACAFSCLNRAEQHLLPLALTDRHGAPVQVTMRAVIQRDASGEPAAAAAVIRQVSRQPREKPSREPADLQDAWSLDQNYQSILRNSGEGILITDLNSRIITANNALVRMLGYENEQGIEGRHLLELAPFEGSFTSATGEQIALDTVYYEAQLKVNNELFAKGHAGSLLYMFHKSGHIVPVEASMALLTDRDGRRRGTIAMCRNVTDRRVAEKQNLEAKLFMENIVATARDGIYVTDGLGQTILVNQAFSDITGYTQSEFIGINPASLLPDDAALVMNDQIINAMNDRDDMSLFETKWQRKDGSIFPVEVCIAVMKTPPGEDNGIVATVRDITDRVVAREALQRSHEELEQKVLERTENLEEMNTALRVLLKGREDDKQTHEEKILANVNELVLPYLNRLKGTRLDERQRASLSIIEANLKDIIAPFGTKTAARNLALTPSEIQIANLIKHGMTAKEIASITSLSPRTIECHRASIRKKLGIKNRKVNLRVFLLSSY